MICNSLIFLHRIKLRGRFHLLMELLSNLLFCLFVPHDRKSKPVGLPAPVWLVAKGTTLSTKHATAYTRVLTTLCSPTVSSAAGTSGAKRRRHDGDVSSLPLKDDVKRERARVGQFVPQLLASYCVAQLEGKLMPHVKSALMPGLWAAMDTVEVETWRAMSSGLDAPARAIWSQTWAEWRRIGGGTKKLRGT